MHRFSSCPLVVLASPAMLLLGLAASPLGNRVSAVEPTITIDSTAAEIRYNRDVRPILAENCFACHGPDSAAREAGLRLDQRESAIELGAIDESHPEQSELIRRILLPADDDLAMPPVTGHKRLRDEDKQTLINWIAQGATYETHWSFLPPRRPPLPDVSDPSWVRGPIDHFVMAKLDEVGLKPAPEADRRTIARRLSLDLTGLPPDPDRVDLFVADSSPEAFERYVDDLLDRSSYGEHRARYWLDYARYADTHGIHFDNFREMWSYRDWVIDAFNRNLSFDQFTIEQLAGDLLPSPTLDQLVATGFNRCNITTNEGGIIDEEYKVLYARDRTETTTAVWLGLTTGCAVCHDHKFDPLTQHDFYALSAFFNNTTQAVRDGNKPDTPPIIAVPLREDRQRFEDLQQELVEATSALQTAKAAGRERFDTESKALDSDDIFSSVPNDALRWHVPLVEGSGSTVVFGTGTDLRFRRAEGPLSWGAGHTGDSALQLSEKSFIQWDEVEVPDQHDQAFSYGAWIRTSRPNTTGAVIAKMNDGSPNRGFDLWLEGNRVGGHIIHAFPDNAVKVVTSKALDANRWYHVLLTYDGSGSASGLQIFVDGILRVDRAEHRASLSDTIQTDAPLRIGGRHGGTAPTGVSVNDVRLYQRQLEPEEIRHLATGTRAAALALIAPADRTTEQSDELFAWWLDRHDPVYQDARSRESRLQAEDRDIRNRGTIAHVMAERSEPAEAFVLQRGEYDQQLEKVVADVPSSLPRLGENRPRSRMGLAQWLLDAENPLTARVTVNRFWQEIFGTGLVATSGDFGITGELPSHPELLDWLAVDFRESGWDIKRLIRTMVSSSTYRQQALATETKLRLDPSNRLLSRGPRFRLDAEVVRDYVLAASGLLSPKIGGASVKPYQPEGVWEAVAMPNSNTRSYEQDHGDALYRRSMYTFWKRSAPPASMDIFNAPSREVCTVRRERTNTPLQALAALNDPQLVEAARHLATTALQRSSQADVCIDWIARRLLARSLDAAESEVVRASLDALLSHYAKNPEDAEQLVRVGDTPVAEDLNAIELAAYTMIANQLINLDEVLTK